VRLADAKLSELPPLPDTLRRLTLKGLKKLKTLPDSFDALSELEEVTLHATAVRMLPPSLCQHPHLQVLRTEYSNLSKLSGKADIHLPSLRVLHLEGRFRTWPKAMSLPNLEDLHLLCWAKELPPLNADRLRAVRVVAPLCQVDTRFAHLPQATITCDEAVLDDLDPAVRTAYGARLTGVRSDLPIG